MPLPPEQHALVLHALAAVRSRFPDAQMEPQGIEGSKPIFRCTVEGETRWIPFLEGDIQLCASLQEARRKVLIYDVQHLPTLQPGFGGQPQEAGLPPVTAPPARARFETHEVVRIPVQVDQRAKDFLDRANQQTRLLGQALAEFFGAIAGVERLTIAYVEPAAVDVPCLLIRAHATDPAQHHFWHVRTDELAARNVHGEPLFQARFAATELARLYIEHINR